MTQWAVIGDTHLDTRGGDETFLSFQINWLLKALRDAHAKGIRKVLQVGDMFDNRKQVRSHVVSRVLKEVLPLLDELDMHLVCLVGNHNIYYRESNRVHNLEWMEAASKRVEVVQEYSEKYPNILLMGWINKSNTEAMMQVLANSKAKYCFGHFEVADMAMYRGVLSKHGMSLEPFQKFDKVMSGHYHTVSSKGNMHYLGSPYHLTWADYPDGQERGWFVFDDETGSLELIRNDPSQTLFTIYQHDPERASDATLQVELEQQLTGRIVKVIVEERGDTRRFNKFIEMVKSVPVIDISINDRSLLTKEQKEELAASVVDLEAIKSNSDVAVSLTNYAVGVATSEGAKALVPTLVTELFNRVQR